MISISEKITIPSPPEAVWPLLSDPATVASCIPGATLAEAGEDGVHRGEIRVKFGPTVATFRGEATLTYDHAARRCTIEGRGVDQRGASRALANGTVVASGETETELSVDGEFHVTGPLETFANAGGVHVARALLAEFATNMAGLVQAGEGAAAGTVEAAAPETAAQPAGSRAGDVHAAVPETQAPASGAAPATGTPPPRVTELSGGKLLWQAFKSWLKQLFRGKRA